MSAHTTGQRSQVQLVAGTFGAVFLLVGVLGFIPGVTTNFGDLGIAGHHSEAMLLGIFQTSALHNIVHLLFGVLGLALARSNRSARLFLVVGGAVYLVLWIYGLAIGDGPANFVPLNMADNWLHLALGAVMLGGGLVLGRKTATN